MAITGGERPLAGKAAFVAGASGGINLEVARTLGRAGARLMLISRSPDRIAAGAAELRGEGVDARGLAADVRDYAAVESALGEAFQALGPLDVVVSGAAGNFVTPALGMSSNGFRTVVDIDLVGTFNVLRASFGFLRRPGASLISITAPQGERPALQQAHVCAAKAGVNMLTRCLAMEWGPAGVRVNAVSPGPIRGTEGMARLAPTPEAEAAVKEKVALRDYGRAQDIGQAVLYLATDSSRYVTGHILACDGGASLGDASGDALTVRPRERASAA
jgi:NAD(P)-dependent dehydrogenase (short-subunit alcohol dehydrogenase family)